jgi:hypothetical protein
MNAQQLAALRLAIDCILEAAEMGGSLGAPSGVVYAAMSAHGMSLSSYQSLLDALQRAGKIEVSDHCIYLPKVG